MVTATCVLFFKGEIEIISSFCGPCCPFAFQNHHDNMTNDMFTLKNPNQGNKQTIQLGDPSTELLLSHRGLHDGSGFQNGSRTLVSGDVTVSSFSITTRNMYDYIQTKTVSFIFSFLFLLCLSFSLHKLKKKMEDREVCKSLKRTIKATQNWIIFL